MTRTLKEYPEIRLKTEDLAEKIDLKKIFGRDGEFHLEIGSGRGTFLIHQAKNFPDVNFIGIEWASRYCRYTIDRIGRWGLKNVRMIRTDAAAFLKDFVCDDSLDCVHIYFPDPWPKKKHHKRRFFSDANLEQIIRCLKKDGTIRLATDHADYFEQMERVLSGKSAHLQKTDFLPATAANIAECSDSAYSVNSGQADSPQVGTNFERKYLKEQRPIYTAAVKKI